MADELNRRRRSEELFDEARRLMPGGVNSPVRAFRAVGGTPVFFVRGQGSVLTDVDGNTYIDYVGSWGPAIVGHAHPRVVSFLKEAISTGLGFGAPTEWEIHLAQLITQAIPSVERVRLVTSGTEATMSALRLARAVTGRSKILKFTGCYHGHVDSLLIKAGSGAATFGVPDSPGVTAGTAEDTMVLPYNDLAAVEELFAGCGDQISAVIVEPVAANMGLVLPQPGFLEGLRRLTTAAGTLLIFDEVITGFRLGWGGAQTHCGVVPDLTCLGKIIGGGLPVGAYGGRADLMDRIAPSGPVYQAGTLAGNPLAVRAGLATLSILRDGNPYKQMAELTQNLLHGLLAEANRVGLPVWGTHLGSLFGLFFTEGPVTDFTSASRSDTAAYARYFHSMLEQGIYLAPSQFEAGFLSMAHSQDQVEQTIRASRRAFEAAAKVAAGG